MEVCFLEDCLLRAHGPFTKLSVAASASSPWVEDPHRGQYPFSSHTFVCRGELVFTMPRYASIQQRHLFKYISYISWSWRTIVYFFSGIVPQKSITSHIITIWCLKQVSSSLYYKKKSCLYCFTCQLSIQSRAMCTDRTRQFGAWTCFLKELRQLTWLDQFDV